MGYGMTNRPHELNRPRLPTTWEDFLALASGDPFRVVLCEVPLDDEDSSEPEAENPEQLNGMPVGEARRGNQPHPRTRRGQHVAHVRGVLAERVVWSTELDPFLDLKGLSKYSDLSVRKLRDYLGDLRHPLPSYKVGGKILVRRSEFDHWIAAYRQRGGAQVDAIVDDVLRSVRDRKDALTP